MNRKFSRVLGLPLVTAAVFGASAASGAGNNVRAVCPGIDATLQEALAPAWSRFERPGVVRVKMDVQGQRVTGVSTTGVPSPYGQYVKRAVSGLSCSSASDQPRSLQFEVSFVGPDDAGARAGS